MERGRGQQYYQEGWRGRPDTWGQVTRESCKKIVIEKEIQARIPLEMTLMTPLTVFNMLLDYC